MGIFGFKKKEKKVEFQITEDDKLWVEENFNWLVGSLGLPNKEAELILYTDKYFPDTYADNEFKVENLIKDLSNILQLNSVEISFEIEKDIRDFQGVPYEIEGPPFETETEKSNNGYKIFIANSLPPNRVLHRLICEFIGIKLHERELKFDTGDDTDLFIYIAGVYLGFGVILSESLFDMGYKSDGFWETKWNYNSVMPYEIMAYCFAIHIKLCEHEILPLKEKLPIDFYNLLKSALEYVELYPSELLSKTELEANALYFQADKLIKNHDYELAILKLNEIISITDKGIPISFISFVFGRLGYIEIRKGKFAESIPYLEKALEIDGNNFEARDNISYALIKIGEIKEGKKHIDKSISLAVKDMGFIYRNLALYFWAKGNIEEAEENFILSFESVSIPVFLLEFDYSKFLLAKGEKEKSNNYLQLSIKKGEPEAMKNE